MRKFIVYLLQKVNALKHKHLFIKGHKTRHVQPVYVGMGGLLRQELSLPMKSKA